MANEKRLIDANALKEKLQESHDFFVDGVGGFRYLTPKDKARVDEITNCMAEVCNAPTIDAIPIDDIKKQIDRIDIAEQFDQAGGYSYLLRDALRKTLAWYEHERRADK